MTDALRHLLQEWAGRYHHADFIAGDPVRFPHRYTRKQDIEISGLLTAVMSFGNRKQILKKAEQLHVLLGDSPYRYVLSRRWESDFAPSDTSSYYRMLSHADFHRFFCKLYDAYTRYTCLEEALSQYAGIPMERLCMFLGVSSRTPQKKLNMFLRWMVRRHSLVDFGIWTGFNAADLIIPLDTHVCRVAHSLKLTESATFSLGNAKRITDALSEIFPGDPCLGDFALFGSGVNGFALPGSGNGADNLPECRF